MFGQLVEQVRAALFEMTPEQKRTGVKASAKSAVQTRGMWTSDKPDAEKKFDKPTAQHFRAMGDKAAATAKKHGGPAAGRLSRQRTVARLGQGGGPEKRDTGQETGGGVRAMKAAQTRLGRDPSSAMARASMRSDAATRRRRLKRGS